MKTAQKIAIRNAIAARSSANDNGDRAPKAPRAKGFDLERIISGEASRSTMRRFMKSIEGMDGDLMSVDQSRAAQAAEQALAPKQQDTTPFRSTFFFDSIESKTTNDDAKTDYLVMRGCEITTPSGEKIKRTVLAFGAASKLISSQVLGGQDIDVDIVFAGSVMKVVEPAVAETIAEDAQDEVQAA